MIPGIVSGQAVGPIVDDVGTGGDEGTGAPVTDPHFASVVLLAVWDGLDSDSNFDDVSNSNHALSAFGDAQTDTDFTILDEATLLLDGNGDYVSIPDSDDFHFTGPFTIEFLARPDVTTSAASYGLLGQWNGSAGVGNFQIWYTVSTATQKRFRANYSPTGSSTVDLVVLNPTNTNIDQSVAHHVCLERDGSDTIRLYLDGVMVDSEVSASGATNLSQPLRIGDANGIGSNLFQGRMSPVRITKGVARYASDSGFTAPSAPFPRS